VEDADWEHRLLWKKQTVRTDYCGLWRLDAQFIVENGDWKKRLLWIMETREQIIMDVAVGEHTKK
jgi:hypothetical protein